MPCNVCLRLRSSFNIRFDGDGDLDFVGVDVDNDDELMTEHSNQSSFSIKPMIRFKVKLRANDIMN